VPFDLQIHHGIRKNANAQERKAPRDVARVFCGKGRLSQILAKLPQRAMINASVNERIKRLRSLRSTDDEIGPGNRDLMK